MKLIHCLNISLAGPKNININKKYTKLFKNKINARYRRTYVRAYYFVDDIMF